jgi:CheY-like chemotaxis protein
MVSPQFTFIILIIENDHSNRRLVEQILSMSGYRYVSASNGHDALDYLKQGNADLILTDISMPGLDGFSVASMIRAMPRFINTPIIAVTAHSLGSERQKILLGGCTDLLTKPYRPKDLLDMIAYHLEKTTANTGGLACI